MDWSGCSIEAGGVAQQESKWVPSKARDSVVQKAVEPLAVAVVDGGDSLFLPSFFFSLLLLS